MQLLPPAILSFVSHCRRSLTLKTWFSVSGLIVLCCLAIAASLATAWMESIAVSRAEALKNPLVLESGSLQIGRIPNHVKHYHEFRVQNIGPVALRIDAIETSCSCSGVSPKSFSLEPGESKAVGLEFSPSGYGRTGAEQFDVHFAFISGKQVILERNLTGIAFAPISTEQPKFAFRNSIPFAQSALSQTFSIRAPPEVQSLEVNVNQEKGRIVDLHRFDDANGSTWQFQVALSQQSRIGLFSFPILIAATVAGYPAYQCEMQCSGLVESDIRFWPETISIAADMESGARDGIIEVWSQSGGSIENLTAATACSKLQVSVKSQGSSVVSSSTPRQEIVATYLGDAPAAFGSIVVSGYSEFHEAEFQFVVPYSVHLFQTPSITVSAGAK